MGQMTLKTGIMRGYGALHSAVRSGIITQGPHTPQVALTFDDGPDPRFTPQILDILDAANAFATFFMLGAHIEKHRHIAEETAQRKHEICSHLFTHNRDVPHHVERFDDEMKRTSDLISQITGEAPRFMRFPFAYMGDQHPNQVSQQYNMHAVHWSFSGMDSRLDGTQVAKRICARLYPGAIVLLHDGVGNFSKYSKDRQATIDALPAILATCQERCLEPVTLSTMMASI